MTPAVNLAKKLNLSFTLHEYEHDTNTASYGLEAASKLSVAAECIFKTLVVRDENKKLAVAVVPVTAKLDLKCMASVLKCKKIQLADATIAERSTGYILGGISPLGQKKRLPTIIDATAQNLDTIYVSGGKRGLEIGLPPEQLAKTLEAKFANITSV